MTPPDKATLVGLALDIAVVVVAILIADGAEYAGLFALAKRVFWWMF